MNGSYPSLNTMMLVAGLGHFLILIASVSVPFVLDWKRSLAPLNTFMKRLVWVYGAFIVLTVVGFGAISVFHADLLVSGGPLARSFCSFVALFWFVRLVVQFLVFDVSEVIHNPLLMFGYHGLTLIFAYFVVVYSWAALIQGET